MDAAPISGWNYFIEQPLLNSYDELHAAGCDRARSDAPCGRRRHPPAAVAAIGESHPDIRAAARRGTQCRARPGTPIWGTRLSSGRRYVFVPVVCCQETVKDYGTGYAPGEGAALGQDGEPHEHAGNHLPLPAESRLVMMMMNAVEPLSLCLNVKSLHCLPASDLFEKRA